MTDEVCSEGGDDGCREPVKADGLCARHILAAAQKSEGNHGRAKRSDGRLIRHWEIREALEKRLADALEERRRRA